MTETTLRVNVEKVPNPSTSGPLVTSELVVDSPMAADPQTWLALLHRVVGSDRRTRHALLLLGAGSVCVAGVIVVVVLVAGVSAATVGAAVAGVAAGLRLNRRR